jgi:hypothetical protein
MPSDHRTAPKPNHALNSQHATILISIDGINAFMLGFQGNTSIETIAFDSLAVSGIAFEFAYAASCDLATVMDHITTGADGNRITDAVNGRCVLVSDCDVAIQTAEASKFDAVIPVKQGTGTSEGNASRAPVQQVAQTQAADFFAAATEVVHSMEQGDFLWLHFSGLSACWDAPIEMREHFRAPDDPEVFCETTPPNFDFDADRDDPDLLVSAQQACLAQVTVIDQVLGVFLEDLDRHPIGRSALRIVTGTRGYSLGDHGYVGIGKTLHAPTLHVPLLVRIPESDQQYENRRSHRLLQTSAIGRWITDPQTIIDDCEIIMASDGPPIFFAAGDDVAIQNASWKFLRQTDSDTVTTRTLFAKPDDRWEVNDVAKRCPQIVDELEKALLRR